MTRLFQGAIGSQKGQELRQSRSACRTASCQSQERYDIFTCNAELSNGEATESSLTETDGAWCTISKMPSPVGSTSRRIFPLASSLNYSTDLILQGPRELFINIIDVENVSVDP